jgi:DNA-binding response OmpR family regulator
LENQLLIALVEDEVPLQEVLALALEEAGYAVARASDGREAIRMLEAQSSDFRALITDIKLLPGKLTGWDVAQRARELNPELPVIYMSGDGGEDWPSKGVPKSVFISKPFAPAQIVTAVSQLLNDNSSTL